MFKVTKQSPIDWKVTKDGQPFAWITNHKGGRAYVVTFRHIDGEYTGFRSLADAKKFATTA